MTVTELDKFKIQSRFAAEYPSFGEEFALRHLTLAKFFHDDLPHLLVISDDSRVLLW